VTILAKNFIKQLTLPALFFALAFFCQTLLFKTRSNSWVEVLGSRPWLYLIYFVVAHVAAERVVRRIR
jgi:hypothetical protein